MERRIRQALGDHFGAEVARGASLNNLGGHASLRIYWRIELPTGGSYARYEITRMAMVLPEGDGALFLSEVEPAW